MLEAHVGIACGIGYVAHWCSLGYGLLHPLYRSYTVEAPMSADRLAYFVRIAEGGR